MKVSELIEELQKVPQDLDVYRAKDNEGNGFDEVNDAEEMVMGAYGEIGFRKLTPGLIRAGYTEEDLQEGADVIIIW